MIGAGLPRDEIFMQPMFFGPATRQLFGSYHPPSGTRHREEGVLCCMPIGHEYMRAYRAMRQLAELLAADGYHVLRFDYSATGDSSRAATAAEGEAWRDDVRCACQELRDLGGLDRLSLVGLRYGAMLGAQATVSDRDLRTLVLWDPVVNGRAYLDQLTAMHAEQRRLFGSGAGRPARRHAQAAGDDLLGYEMHAPLRADLAASDLTPLVTAHRARSVLVAAERLPAYDRLCTDVERSSKMTLDVRIVPDAADWADVRKSGGVLFLGPILTAIVECIRGAGS